MTQCGVEDAAFSVVDDHEVRLFFAIEIGDGGGEDGDVLGGAAEVAIEFILGVQPARGKPFGDGVVWSLDFDHEFMLWAMSTAFAGALIPVELTVFDVEPGAGFFVAPTPAADTDHAIVFWPIAEGVVGGVDGDKAAAVFDVFIEGTANGFWPGLAVVIADDDIEISEGWVPGGPGRGGRAFGWRRGDSDGKGTAAFEGVAQNGGGDFPLVIVLPIEDESFQLGFVSIRDG